VNLLAALGAAPGRAEFFDVEANALSTLNPALAAPATEAHGFGVVRRTVQVLTLAEVCEAYAAEPIHFLKVDCEGA